MVGAGILTLLSLLLIVLSGQYLGKTVFTGYCHDVARVTYLVAPTVFDTVESYRKCRRPVGAGMMLPTCSALSSQQQIWEPVRYSLQS